MPVSIWVAVGVAVSIPAAPAAACLVAPAVPGGAIRALAAASATAVPPRPSPLSLTAPVAAGGGPHRHCAAAARALLVHHMGQFVRQQLVAGAGAWVRRILAQEDVAAGGEGRRAHLLVQLVRLGAAVDGDALEARAEGP